MCSFTCGSYLGWIRRGNVAKLMLIHHYLCALDCVKNSLLILCSLSDVLNVGDELQKNKTLRFFARSLTDVGWCSGQETALALLLPFSTGRSKAALHTDWRCSHVVNFWNGAVGPKFSVLYWCNNTSWDRACLHHIWNWLNRFLPSGYGWSSLLRSKYWMNVMDFGSCFFWGP